MQGSIATEVEHRDLLEGRPSRLLVNSFGLPGHVIHQQVLAEGVRSGEVSFAAAHLRHLLHKLHQAVVAGQHEGVDQDSGALALGNFFQRLAYHQRI